MDERVKAFLDAQKNTERARYEREKQKVLVDLGLFEKEYSSSSDYSKEYPFSEWDVEASTYKYYKIIPIEVDDETYEEIKKASNKPLDTVGAKNKVAFALKFIAIALYILGFVAGIFVGDTMGYRYEFDWVTALIYWVTAFVSGTMFLGFAEIIQLLNDIKNK